MSKFKRLITVCLALSLGFVGAWLAVGPRVMASISGMTYHQPTYSYRVEIDRLYDTQSNSFSDIGTLVSVSPNLATTNNSAFSGAYLQTTRERATHWITTRRTDELIDVMLVFTRPLMLEEVNTILNSIKAHVFESGFVGYADGMPFATYTKEEGPLLTRSLQEYVENVQGFEREITEDSNPQAKQVPPDIRGFLAVRIWVQTSTLQQLLDNKNIRIVDTTPQAVRDQIAADRHWKNVPVNAVAIEMPVWAYQW